LVGWIAGWMIGWLDCWLIGWLVGGLVGWMIGWLVGHWLVGVTSLFSTELVILWQSVHKPAFLGSPVLAPKRCKRQSVFLSESAVRDN